MDYAELIFDGVVLGRLPKITSVYGKEVPTEGVIKAYMFVGEDCGDEEESEGYIVSEDGYGVDEETDVSQRGEDTAQDGRLTFVTGIKF